jgi:hypothetical protein
MLRPSHLLWFDHPNNIWWRVQIIKPIIVQFSTSFSQFFSLSSNTLLKHFILNHPQSMTDKYFYALLLWVLRAAVEFLCSVVFIIILSYGYRQIVFSVDALMNWKTEFISKCFFFLRWSCITAIYFLDYWIFPFFRLLFIQK